MSPRCGEHRLRPARRAADTPSIPVMGLVGSDGPVLLSSPSSLTQCVPSNITWTGGTQPYTLFVKFEYSSETLRQFDLINATHFLWTPDVPAGTLVSLQLIDERNVLIYTEDAILVGAGPSGAECHMLVPMPMPPSTSVQGALPTPTFTSSIHSATQSQSPSSLRVPSAVTVSGSTIALMVLGIVVLLLLGTFLWWRFCVTTRARKNRNGAYRTSLYRLSR